MLKFPQMRAHSFCDAAYFFASDGYILISNFINTHNVDY